MAKVRLTPVEQPSTGVREEYTGSVANIPSSGIGAIFQGISDATNAYAKYKSADKANEFVNYKNQLATIQKDTQMNMSLAPDAQTRQDLMADGYSQMKELAGGFEYNKDKDVYNFTNTFTDNYQISSKGLWAKLSIDEQRFKLDENATNIATADLPVNIAIQQHEELLAGHEGGVISSVEATDRRNKFNVVVQKQYLDTSKINPDSLSNITTTISDTRFNSPESLSSNITGIDGMYERNKVQVRSSDLTEVEKTQRINNIEIAQAKLPSIMNSMYAKQNSELISEGSRMINEIFDKPVMTAGDTQNLTDMINSVPDANTRESLEKIYNTKRLQNIKQVNAATKAELTLRKDNANNIINKAKSYLASGEVTTQTMLKSIESKLFITSKSKTGDKTIKSINPKLTADELSIYSGFYTTLSNKSDEVLNLTESTVSKQKSYNMLPKMTESEIRKSIVEDTGDDWEDLTVEQRMKSRAKVTKNNRKYNNYFSDRLYKLIDGYYIKYNKLPDDTILEELTTKAHSDTLQVNFIKNSLSDFVTDSSKRTVKKASIWEQPMRRNPVTNLPYDYRSSKIKGSRKY